MAHGCVNCLVSGRATARHLDIVIVKGFRLDSVSLFGDFWELGVEREVLLKKLLYGNDPLKFARWRNHGRPVFFLVSRFSSASPQLRRALDQIRKPSGQSASTVCRDDIYIAERMAARTTGRLSEALAALRISATKVRRLRRYSYSRSCDLSNHSIACRRWQDFFSIDGHRVVSFRYHEICLDAPEHYPILEPK